MPLDSAGQRPLAHRLADWMGAWDGAVRGLLAERPGTAPDVLRPFSALGIGIGAGVAVAAVAAVAKIGPSPLLPPIFLAFAVLYLALAPLGALRRPFGPGGRRTDADDVADLAEAAVRARRAWEETASRAVAAWHLARETTLAKLEPLLEEDPEARVVALRIRDLTPPVAPLPGTEIGSLRRAASLPLTELPSLEGWGAVAGGVVYMARRKPFTLAEVLVVLAGIAAVPPSVFLAIDGLASAVTCAVLPADVCAEPKSARNLFVAAIMALAGLALLWRVVTRTRFDCPACGAQVGIPRLARAGRCHGCGRRVWVSWRK